MVGADGGMTSTMKDADVNNPKPSVTPSLIVVLPINPLRALKETTPSGLSVQLTEPDWELVALHGEGAGSALNRHLVNGPFPEMDGDQVASTPGDTDVAEPGTEVAEKTRTVIVACPVLPEESVNLKSILAVPV